MVVRLQPPTIDDIEYTQAVIDERRNGRNAGYFGENADWWKERIAEYNRFSGDPTRITSSIVTDEHKDKYINLYSGSDEEKRQVREIRQLRKRRPKLLVCPACGEDGTPRTLDHYLPKSVFPEFAVHLKNLVPMCDICQEIKGDEYVTVTGEKIYFHSYFDTIPDALFIIEISPPYHVPSGFKLCVSEYAGAAGTLALRHAEGLNLQQRIEEYCVEKYSHLLKSAATNRIGANIEIPTLIQAFLTNEQQKASNGWAALFYRSVLRNTALLGYLATGPLPDCYLP
jgi:5-methylcytosine-specific restriction endonuclease McrA